MSLLSPLSSLLPVLLFLGVLSACTVTRPTVKIGLVAPFEGAYRSLGYDVIWAVRLAVREANTEQSIPGYGLELVALDDMGDADRAREQAAKLAADPQVVAVLGHWRSGTTAAAAPDYATAGLPLLATGGVEPDPTEARYALWGRADCLLRGGRGCIVWLGGEDTQSVCALAPLSPDSTDAGFSDRYRALSGGVEPTFASVAAYDATRALIAAIAQADAPTRAGVSTSLAHVTLDGLSGAWAFSETGERRAPGPWGYRRQADGAWVLDPTACAATP
ncbi:MAG: ABC transporter substrate-binding protein [Anaerolineales bacterium]|nr:ABC transporter substrate-binding protein [Anaerolineales bacterium]